MKSTITILILLCGNLVAADSPAAKELKTLTEQRDKAAEAVLKPINERYWASLEQLLAKAMKAGDLEGSNQIRSTLAASRGDLTPERIVGKWRSVGPTGSIGFYTFRADGTAEFQFSNGRVNPNVWRVRDNKLLVATADKTFSITYEFDGEVLVGRSEDGKEGFTATREP